MNNLILSDEYDNLCVVNLPNGISFVHDNKTGKNYFNNKTIAKCTGLDEATVRRHWMSFKDLNTNVQELNVTLKIHNIDRPVVFKSFDFLTYVSYRSNKDKAIQMRNYISDAIDEKFNKDVGFQKPMVERLADAMNVEKVKQAERIKELESQVLSMSKRLGNQRALEKEVVQLKEEVARSNIEIADLYGKLGTMKGNYWKRELEKVQSFVNHSLDEWR